MTTPDLAAALEDSISDRWTPSDMQEYIRLAAQRLRELEAVRVAAANMDRAWHRAENGDRTAREFAAADALRAALGRVGGG